MRLNIPAGARLVAEYNGWTLYELSPRERDSFLWQKFKLMRSPEERAAWGHRRVYRLAWNFAELRFASDRHLAELQSTHPDIFGYVETHMSLNYTVDRLPASAEEIAAEIARLKSLRAARRRKAVA
jgi:hypothetical protein